MILPEPMTEKFLLGLASFHEAGAEWYGQHDQPGMEEWSRKMVEFWRRKVKECQAKGTGT